MYKIESTSYFRKKYKKLTQTNKFLQAKILKVLETLRSNPFCKSLKSHKVNTPRFGNTYSSSITKDLRIIWTLINKDLVILLLDIGGHSGNNKVY